MTDGELDLIERTHGVEAHAMDRDVILALVAEVRRLRQCMATCERLLGLETEARREAMRIGAEAAAERDALRAEVERLRRDAECEKLYTHTLTMRLYKHHGCGIIGCARCMND